MFMAAHMAAQILNSSDEGKRVKPFLVSQMKLFKESVLSWYVMLSWLAQWIFEGELRSVVNITNYVRLFVF